MQAEKVELARQLANMEQSKFTAMAKSVLTDISEICNLSIE